MSCTLFSFPADGTRDKTHHAYLRRLVSPAFSNNAFHEYEPTIRIKYYFRVIEGIKVSAEKNLGTVTVSRWFNNMTFEL